MADEPLPTAIEFQRQVDDLRAEIARLTPASVPAPNLLERFLASGTFFILLGLGLLYLAYLGLITGVHTSFSFVLVVLGVAILLYGTGTQGVGKLQSDSTTAKYNVALAGGAGVLAIAIGFGMIKFAPDIRQTFDIGTRYVQAQLSPNGDGTSSFANYWSEFTVDGMPIASYRRGDVILAYVPYVDTQANTTKRVAYTLRTTWSGSTNASFKQEIKSSFEVIISEVDRHNSGSDFPTYYVKQLVDVRSQQTAEDLTKAASDRQLSTVPGKAAPEDVPPASVVLDEKS